MLVVVKAARKLQTYFQSHPHHLLKVAGRMERKEKKEDSSELRIQDTWIIVLFNYIQNDTLLDEKN